ncbi:hypothetical protein VR44_19340 [Streptomyces katrae]|uniref:Uncharacterized protein n=1 Tax=Streptomyces katrae TaxID=68223 RepID=A0A0F4JAT6_9ACTN|nr:hypothetical protein VR44_19340 [Streptomyces katrae]
MRHLLPRRRPKVSASVSSLTSARVRAATLRTVSPRSAPSLSSRAATAAPSTWWLQCPAFMCQSSCPRITSWWSGAVRSSITTRSRSAMSSHRPLAVPCGKAAIRNCTGRPRCLLMPSQSAV